MSRDQGRTVQHFGKWYLWSVSPTGNLTLVLVDRLTDQIRHFSGELTERLRKQGIATSAARGSLAELAGRVADEPRA